MLEPGPSPWTARLLASSTDLQRKPSASGSGMSLGLGYLYVVWLVILFDVHRWIAYVGPSAAGRAAAVLLVPLVVIVAVQGPMILARRGRHVWLPLLLALVGSAAITVPLALNRGYAWDGTKLLLIYYVLCVGTAALVREPRHLVPILFMYVAQFGWWLVHSGTSGAVRWHSVLGNPDGFGSVMAFGVGIGTYFGLAMPRPRLRFTGLILALGSLFGVVASFARGAFLGAVAVAAVMFLRSRNKARGALGMTAALLTIVVGAAILFPGGTFWTEMQSIFTQGMEAGTGADRRTLWQMAIQVWKENPLLGVGPDNFGVFAAQYFSVGAEIAGQYAENPGRLYNRSLHSTYFQVLSELGTVGSLAFLTIVVDFWRRNRRLRSADALAAWSEQGMGRYDLRAISLGLEAAMVAYLVAGVFYAVYLYLHWLYSLYTINSLLYAFTSRQGHEGSAPNPGVRARAPRQEHARVWSPWLDPRGADVVGGPGRP